MAAAGLVTASVKPYATLYRLNRDHILWPVVKAALPAVDELRTRIREYAADHGPAGLTIALYRSVDRGDATADSDVDLVVVVPDDTTSAAADDFVYELGERVRARTGNFAQIIRITTAELQESSGRKDALIDTGLTEGNVLIGHAIPVEA